MSLVFVSSDCDMVIRDRQDPLNQSGAWVEFFGLVRGMNHDKEVAYLDYEAYDTLASSMFLSLTDEVKRRFLVHEVEALHRIGRVFCGQKAVLIKVRAAHRHEAFLACQYLMHELKKTLPIWRKEVYVDQTFSYAQGVCALDQVHLGDILKPSQKALTARGISSASFREKRLLLVGAGGLGCPLALHIACLGFGHLTVFDGDKVELSNLARQFMYTTIDVGQPKSLLLKRFVEERNPLVSIDARTSFIDEGEALAAAQQHDVIIDATDCPYTKNMLKYVAFTTKTPLVSGSVYQAEGEVLVYNSGDKRGGCPSCFHGQTTKGGLSCANTGVLPHVCSVVAALMAEYVLGIVNKSFTDACRFTLFDAISMTIKNLVIPKDEHCTLCGIRQEKKTAKLVRLVR